MWSEDSILSIVTGLWAGKSGVQFLGGSNNCSFLYVAQTCSGAHPAFCSLGTGVLFVGINQPWHEAYHSPPSSSKVKNEWSYTGNSPVCIYGIHRDNFTFRIRILKQFIYLSGIFNSCHCLPETKCHSSLFLHWPGSKFLVMAACTPSIHFFLGCPLFLLFHVIHSIISFG